MARSSQSGKSEDRSLIEISNDDGDHYVADIPTNGVKATERALKQAGASVDNDDRLARSAYGQELVSNRDSTTYRYRSASVEEKPDSDYEPDSDSEPDYEGEDSRVDDEPSEQTASRWWSKLF